MIKFIPAVEKFNSPRNGDKGLAMTQIQRFWYLYLCMVTLRAKLYAHQANCVKFHLAHKRSGNWSEMGVGKSLIALAVMKTLHNSGVIQRMLIVCPLSVVETWKSEIKRHTTFEFTVLTGSLQQKLKALNNSTPIFIISYDSIPGRKQTLGVLFGALVQRGFDFIVCDECTYIKNYRAMRTKALISLCDRAERTLFLSGTPIANKPDEVLTIYRAMDSGATFGRNFFAARNMYFINHGRSFPDWQLRPDKISEFREKLFQHCIRILKSECLDLPEKIYTERFAYLTDEQLAVYRPIAAELLHELQLPSGRLTIANKLVKLAKLSQITSGFVYTEAETQIFRTNPKLRSLEETLNEIPTNAKVIIFVRWREDIEIIKRLLDSRLYKYTIISGATKDREGAVNTFTKDPNVKVLVAQITAGAYGLNLAAANYVIYYSVGFSATEWWQSQDRIHRIGQRRNCVYISLCCADTIDTYILANLRNKTDISKSLVDSNSLLRLKNNLEILCKGGQANET